MSAKQTPQQLAAANPSHSVWVSASAGTGKTRVLVNRMLRLMLEGSRPEKLLCITFTKAAAAEVLQRIQEAVIEWSYLEHEKLSASLYSLLERTPHKDEVKRARHLLPLILQSPGGMKILTIHAFCQSVLARFPLEAKVPPGFTVCDESQSQLLLRQAKHLLLEQTTMESHPWLFDSLTYFFEQVSESDQNGLILEALSKRYRLRALMRDFGNDHKAIQQHIFKFLGLHPDILKEDRTGTFLSAIDHGQLRSLMDILRTEKRATPHKTAALIDIFIHDPRLETYKPIFLNKDASQRKDTFKYLENLPPHVFDTLSALYHDLERFITQEKRIALARDTFSFLHICLHILDIYQNLKHSQGMLDYEDQILKTAELLSTNHSSAWVHYKLDGGIDHILVDEAQDTSPAQWDIIRKLTEEFFVGDALKPSDERTLFVVGDEKQSIFSFQNADPIAFSESRQYFAEKANQSGTSWEDISLSDNFRSSALILAFTDQIFSNPEYARHISHHETDINHTAFHKEYPANIEIWPLLVPEENARHAPEYLLANQIADRVQELLRQKPFVHNGRPLQPGDIMVLVRKRHPMIAPLTKAFKDRNIPVTSADRLVLKDHLAVQDCMVAIQSCLNPHDDYAFACFLKSPFIGIDEATLYELAKDRETSLYTQFMNTGNQPVIDYISRLSKTTTSSTPGETIHSLMTQPCPADARSGRHAMVTRLGYDSDDVLNDLQNTAYQYENEHRDGCQGFLTWIQNENRVIKRESSDVDNSRVQIMTVHASKGLQASVVFLADAYSKPQHYKRSQNLIWPQETLKSFLWSAGKEHDAEIFDREKDIFIDQQFSEYYRLLYVAVTRAQQTLILCGHQGKKSSFPLYPSWYELCLDAANQIKSPYEVKTLPDGGMHITQPGSITPKPKQKADMIFNTPLPATLLALPEQEKLRARPLRPSQPPGMEVTTISPLQPIVKNPFKRGQILHNLFYIVPDYPVNEQEEILHQLIAHYIEDEKERASAFDEVMAVLRNSDFMHLFTPNARSEVPIIGEVMIDGHPYAMSGQIDRLLIEDDRILVVDYKTNRPPILDADKIPEAYRFQMRAYRLLLEKIYPGRTVETALLWTSIPYLLPVSG